MLTKNNGRDLLAAHGCDESKSAAAAMPVQGLAKGHQHLRAKAQAQANGGMTVPEPAPGASAGIAGEEQRSSQNNVGHESLRTAEAGAEAAGAAAVTAAGTESAAGKVEVGDFVQAPTVGVKSACVTSIDGKNTRRSFICRLAPRTHLNVVAVRFSNFTRLLVTGKTSPQQPLRPPHLYAPAFVYRN